MSDWISDLVDAQLSADRFKVAADKCPNCRLNWHGTSKFGCDGGFGLSPAALTAVESQGVLDWTEL